MRVVTIFGGPGTGKTHELGKLYAEAVKKYGVKNVEFVSFTRSQVSRGISVAKKSTEGLNKKSKKKMKNNFRTVHSVSRKSYDCDTKIVDASTVDKMSEYLHTNMEPVVKGIAYMRNSQKDDKAVGANIAGMTTRDFQKYERFYDKVKEGASKKGAKAIDFSDMLEDVIKSGYRSSSKVAFVDEAQDLSPLQWRAVYSIYRDVDILYVAGDPNQALYRFLGGASDYMTQMRADETIFLDRSRRCSKNVMLMAERVWSKLTKKVDMPLPKDDSDDGFAVFYPNNNIGLRYLDPIKNLLSKGKKVLVLANTYYQLYQARERLLGENYKAFPHDFVSGRLKERWKNRQINLLTFSTVHSAKGMEADFVLYDASCGEAGRFRDFGSESEKWDDYWRILYTGITRARSKLVVCQLSNPKAGEPNCLELLYYAKYGTKNYVKFCYLKPLANASARGNRRLCDPPQKRGCKS